MVGSSSGLQSQELYTPQETDAIKGYISRWAFQMPDELRNELVPDVKQRMEAAVDACAKEVMLAIEADSTKTKSRLKMDRKFAFHDRYITFVPVQPVKIALIFQNLFFKKYKIYANMEESFHAAGGTPRDTLLGEFHSESVDDPDFFNVTLSWSNSNQLSLMRVGQEPKLTYTPKVHLANEWQACREGRGTDVTVRVTDSQEAVKEFPAHKAKLLMHAGYFVGACSQKFKPALAPEGESAEGEKAEQIDESVVTLTGFSHAAFERLLKFIYLGELVDDKGAEPTLNYQELSDLYHAANYCQVPGMKEWCVKGFSALFKDKKIKEELADLLKFGLDSADEPLVQLCFAHFTTIEKMKSILVQFVTKENIDYLSKIAASYPAVSTVLMNCREYKLGLPKEAPLVPAKKEDEKAAAGGSGSSSGSSGSL